MIWTRKKMMTKKNTGQSGIRTDFDQDQDEEKVWTRMKAMTKLKTKMAT